jgi:hypothetical protein
VTFAAAGTPIDAGMHWQASWCAPPPQRPDDRGRLLHLLRMGWRWGAQRQPLLVAKHHSPELRRQLATAVRTFQPTAVLVEMAAMAQYLPQLRAVPTIFTDHEAGAPPAASTGFGALADRRDAALWRRYVRATYPLADCLQAVTAEDAATLAQVLGRPVGVRRAALVVPARPVTLSGGAPRALFLGDYRHHPNPEAAARLVREVWPAVRAAIPAAELWFAGPNHEQVAARVQAPGVRWLGFAPDLPALFGQVRALLAPVYSGSGFRVKHLTALAHGVPVVTNRLGARGLDAPAPACTQAESSADLAAAAVRLLANADAAAAAGAAAHRWALANLSIEAVSRHQVSVAAEVAARRNRP